MKLVTQLGLLGAFAAVAGCHKAETAPAHDLLGTYHRFNVDVDAKRVELSGNGNRVVYDFSNNTVTTQRASDAASRETRDLSDPALNSELKFYQKYSEALYCGERDEKINGTDSVTYTQGCATGKAGTRIVKQ